MSAPRTLLSIDRVTKRFGRATAVDAVSLDIRENEFFALLGPSSCGKTTLLRLLAGFETLDGGRILLDGIDIAPIPPNRRPLNMMFQSYALFPHMTVRDNVAYGLRAEKLGKDEIATRVDEVLRTVDLVPLVDRRPHQLSGGQRQRVALARAIVKRPRVLLLDEPLAALDRKLRQEMQIELKRLQHEVGLTFVVVTHDQEEAMSMADRIAVMHMGRVLQMASPQELYARPVDHFVAAFVGKMNFLPGRVADGGVEVEGVGRIVADVAGHDSGDEVWLAVRPEQVRLADAAATTDGLGVGGMVEAVAFVGSQVHTHVVVDGGHGVFVVTGGPGGEARGVGVRARVTWTTDAAMLLPRA